MIEKRFHGVVPQVRQERPACRPGIRRYQKGQWTSSSNAMIESSSISRDNDQFLGSMRVCLCRFQAAEGWTMCHILLDHHNQAMRI